jgi:hypothetical protein
MRWSWIARPLRRARQPEILLLADAARPDRLVDDSRMQFGNSHVLILGQFARFRIQPDG